ncbi:MAG: hypothetical protein U1E26_09245 [Coriobacteriia bacterium]|nr:hypothetical protein [Coriobacteriia bacterium]
MTQDSSGLPGAVRRGWVIVLVSVLVGVAVAYFATRQMPTTSFTGTQRVTIAGTASGPQNPPSPDDLVGATTLAIVRRDAEESLGLQKGALDGVVAAKNDSGDRRTVIFTAKAGSEADAEAYAKAIADASSAYILQRFDVYLQVQGEIIKRMTERKAELEQGEKALLALAAKATGAERAGYEQALVVNRNQIFSASDALASAQNAELQVLRSMVPGVPSVAQSTTGGLALSALLQGALVGLLVGLAIVGIREWLRTRSAVA